MREDHEQGLMGWVLGVGYRGHGYAAEGVKTLLRYAFSELDLHRVYAKTSNINVASRRLMERVGMRREAHLREAESSGDKWIDVFIYAILADEWIGRYTVS